MGTRAVAVMHATSTVRWIAFAAAPHRPSSALESAQVRPHLGMDGPVLLEHVLHHIVERFGEVPDCPRAVAVSAKRVALGLSAPFDERAINLRDRGGGSRRLPQHVGRGCLRALYPHDHMHMQYSTVLPFAHDELFRRFPSVTDTPPRPIAEKSRVAVPCDLAGVVVSLRAEGHAPHPSVSRIVLGTASALARARTRIARHSVYPTKRWRGQSQQVEPVLLNRPVKDTGSSDRRPVASVQFSARRAATSPLSRSAPRRPRTS